mmetsp:Transcript_145350/g.465722  ORF Transcript_145350/g.465722 Transcript_145350/m.465722 type:complete len:80 (-) Transcript_145350:933-1172(-)
MRSMWRPPGTAGGEEKKGDTPCESAQVGIVTQNKTPRAAEKCGKRRYACIAALRAERSVQAGDCEGGTSWREPMWRMLR